MHSMLLIITLIISFLCCLYDGKLESCVNVRHYLYHFTSSLDNFSIYRYHFVLSLFSLLDYSNQHLIQTSIRSIFLEIRTVIKISL